MDVLSHGLWGGVLFGERSRSQFWTAFGFGVAPDLVTFSPVIIEWAIHGEPALTRFGPPPLKIIPPYVFQLYDFTHSLIVWAIASTLLWIFLRKLFWPSLAWGFHILCDIPTHTTSFFPTPFLWPFPTPYLNGFRWSRPWFMISNYLLLLLVFIFLRKRRHSRSDKTGE
jgi:membrane-bound metal-dependent hydrolase YbcI (DUF457 family)